MLGRRLLLICCVSLYLVSCQKENGYDSNPAVTNPPGTSSGTVNKATLLQLVNNVRQLGCTCGSVVMPPVAAVTWNDQLATAAFNHSNEMNSNNYFSHTGLNGSTAGDRITAAGYSWKAYGENLAYDNTDEKGVVKGWIGSPPHCQTLMSPLYNEIGAGRAGVYWTMDFGMR